MSKTVAQGEFAHFGVLCQELQGERWPACTRGVGAQPILPARCWLVWEEPCPCGMRCWLPSRLNGQTLPGSGTRSALRFLQHLISKSSLKEPWRDLNTSPTSPRASLVVVCRSGSTVTAKAGELLPLVSFVTTRLARTREEALADL